MLAFRRLRSLPPPPRYRIAALLNRRFFIQNLCDGFLDLAVALPIPPSLPPYTTTIVFTTVVTRCLLVPVAVWGKQRARRIEEVVLPEIEKQKPIVSKQVLEEMKKEGIRGEKPYLQEFHAKRSIERLTAYRKELFLKYKCRPLPTIVVPVLSQLPVFVIFTVMLGRLSLDPTPFDSESFLTLTTLAHPDPTMTLPIILGVITMANVESSNWMMNTAEREQARKVQEWNEKKATESGKPRIEPKKIIKSTMRILSIGRIIVAAMTPGSITLYWVTSAAFGLIQTWVMDWLDIRRRRLRASATLLEPKPPSGNLPNQSQSRPLNTRSRKRI
ncbi:60Kd inner membrane protein-domain-containing protein [Infundibulicybe gibba]|nr:60Kd inner membrane protein-domain-containing protein [Infundibulicybe gibba]